MGRWMETVSPHLCRGGAGGGGVAGEGRGPPLRAGSEVVFPQGADPSAVVLGQLAGWGPSHAPCFLSCPAMLEFGWIMGFVHPWPGAWRLTGVGGPLRRRRLSGFGRWVPLGAVL